MRILRIADVSAARDGGMSRVILCQGDHMRTMGHEVDYLLKDGLRLSAKGKLRNWLMLPAAIPNIVSRRIKSGLIYDVVDIHEPAAAGYCLLRKVSNGFPPVVVFSHGLERRHQLAELYYRQQHNLPISPSLRFLRLTVAESLFSIRSCDHVITLSSEDRRYLERIGIPKAKITQANNGVGEEFLKAGTAQKPRTDDVRVLFMGTWILRKGTRELVVAMSRVMEKYPNVSLTVAGCSFPKEHVLKEFPQSFYERIKVIPHLSEKQALIDVYRQHNILALPSFFEGQPLVMLEAAAMGLAVVTTSICGMADFISDGKNGLLVPVGDSEALARSLERLIHDPALANRLGENGRLTAQTYSWKRSAETVVGAYEQAIDAGKARCNHKWKQ